jgi:hypothetical protein
MKQEQFKHNLKKAMRQAETERYRNQKILELKDKIELLAWDEQRMSQGGQQVFNEIYEIIQKI